MITVVPAKRNEVTASRDPYRGIYPQASVADDLRYKDRLWLSVLNRARFRSLVQDDWS